MDVAAVKDCCLSCDGYLSSSNESFFSCETCQRNVHHSCVEANVPSDLIGDVFFNYICKNCSEFETDEFIRQKISWVNILTLVLYDLRESSLDISRNGFFHWKIHICNLIEQNWTSFFGMNAKKKKTWIGTVSGTLSHYSPQYFLSGQKVLNESGWWKLSHSLTPAELSQKCGKSGSLLGGPIPQPQMSVQDMERIAEDDGGDEIVDSSSTGHSSSIGDDQESDSHSGSSSSVHRVQSTLRNVMYSRAYVQPSATLSDCLFADDEENEDESLLDVDVDNSEAQMKMEGNAIDRMEMTRSNFSVKVPSTLLDGELREVADILLQPKSSLPSTSFMPNSLVKTEEEEETLPQPEKSLFIKRTKKSLLNQLEDNIKNRTKELGGVPMNEYMEVRLLNSMRRGLAAPIKPPPPSARRLFRKLTVRKLKRERGLSLFNLDRFLGSEGKASKTWQQMDAFITAETTVGSGRILDRFKLNSHVDISGSSRIPRHLSFFCHLIRGSEHFCFRSPYTNRMLKPFIRRDHACFPLWVKLMEELVETVRKKNHLGGIPVPEYRGAPIDYSYIRPWHVPSINAMAREFFWPGINLAECIQYPDFTCVVLYRKLIVGFAVMVPDVRHNETYISFLFTRPEWRKGGIATFMLYHLIQTCMGKDITLHVSATNPALILYQKFGFKVEEFIQDFYEMYLPINSRECKHALFLRLSR